MEVRLTNSLTDSTNNYNQTFMDSSEFERKVLAFISPNEIAYFNRIKASISEDERESFYQLIIQNNTALASHRSMWLVKWLADRFKCTPSDVICALPQFMRLYCTLLLNKVELGSNIPLSEDYSYGAIDKKTQEMMSEIRNEGPLFKF